MGKRSVLVGLVVVLATATGARAENLDDAVNRYFREAIFGAQNAPQVRLLTDAEAVLNRYAALATDLPVASQVPGVTFRYDPELGVYERTSEALGGVFLDRAETLGAGNFAAGASYLYAKLDEFNGGALGNTLSFTRRGLAPGIVGSIITEEASITQQEIAVFATYGITDHWDVNLLLPLLYTTLDLEGFGGAEVQDATVFGASDVHESAFGVGDILLRTKYRFFSGDPVDLAALFTLRAPAGNTDNFQGLGDWTVTPGLILSRAFGPHEVHANVAFELNAADAQRTRARYGVGAAISPVAPLALLLDFVGSSSFVDDTFTFGGGFPAVVERTDILDVRVGMKAQLPYRGVAYIAGILPINHDGIRAQFVPTLGLEFQLD